MELFKARRSILEAVKILIDELKDPVSAANIFACNGDYEQGAFFYSVGLPSLKDGMLKPPALPLSTAVLHSAYGLGNDVSIGNDDVELASVADDAIHEKTLKALEHSFRRGSSFWPGIWHPHLGLFHFMSTHL